MWKDNGQAQKNLTEIMRDDQHLLIIRQSSLLIEIYKDIIHGFHTFLNKNVEHSEHF